MLLQKNSIMKSLGLCFSACAIDAVGFIQMKHMHESRRCFIWSNRTPKYDNDQQQSKTEQGLLLMRKN
jgi:hypothetical protein